MSIWNDCEEHNAFPFYGYPVKPEVKDGKLTLDFPLGYNPSSSRSLVKDMKELEKFVIKLCGKKGSRAVEISEKRLVIELDNDKLSTILYKAIMDGK